MESAKIQTWSANEIPVSSGSEAEIFVPTRLDKVEKVEITLPEIPPPQVEEPPEAVFAISPVILGSLRADPGIEEDISRIIKERSDKAIQERYDSLKAQWEKEGNELKEQATQEGFQKGYEEGTKVAQEKMNVEVKRMESEFQLKQEGLEKEFRDYSDQLFSRLDSLCAEILKEKSGLLHEHEKIWVNAAKHLLTRFQVAESIRIGNSLESWLDETVQEFTDKSSIKIFFNPVDLEKILKDLSPERKNGRWELLSDTQLKEGETRYECDGGGVFFSKTDAFKKLENWVEAVNESA